MRPAGTAMVAALALVWAPRCEEPAAAIAAIREYQRSLGLKPTGNFHRQTHKAVAAYRCYYTGKLELPESYDELRFEKGSEKGCPIDAGKYDVFAYPMEAVASGEAPVTAALAEAAPERLWMVVLHEDFHQHAEDSKLPSAATEAATTLMGFITAAGFAAERAGKENEMAERLAREADLFHEKALIVNRYREQASQLYRLARAGGISRDVALQRKQALFEALGRECRAISQRPASFDSCPGALNNAGLAFDYTYTKHYPTLYELFQAGRRDLRATLERVQGILALPLRTEEEFLEAVRERIAEATRGTE